MCTVLYIPGNDKITMVSLRDESPLRPAAENPKLFQQGEMTSLYPRDQTGGGTWVGANNNGTVIILLNGGFICHERKSHYAKSRGLIVSELLMATDPVNQWMLYDLSAIEPHTLVILQHSKLFQLVWDGVTSHQIQKTKTFVIFGLHQHCTMKSRASVEMIFFQHGLTSPKKFIHNLFLIFSFLSVIIKTDLSSTEMKK